MCYVKIYTSDEETLVIESVNYDVEGIVDIAKEFYYNNKKIIFPMTVIMDVNSVICSREAKQLLLKIIANSEKNFDRGDLAFYDENTIYRKGNGYTFSFKPNALNEAKRVLKLGEKCVIFNRFGVILDVINSFKICENTMIKSLNFVSKNDYFL